MKLAMKRSSYACIILLLVVFLAACDKSPQANNVRSKANKPPAYGDILVQGAIGDASNLIPLLASDSASHAVGGLVFNGLVKYDKNMNIVGDLAESWDITNQRETEGRC
jgi:peptide/nickel transport system substrate-binding protein